MRLRWISVVVVGVGLGPLAVAEPFDRSALEEHAAAQVRPALELYREFLALPNDAHSEEQLVPVIAWLRDQFGQRGFTTTEIETGRIPLLLAERRVAEAGRTVLIYLQADGQPVDPSRWDQASPYQAVLKEPTGDRWRALDWRRLDGPRDPNWRIFARSASDSKGPIVQLLAALDAMAAAGLEPDFDLKVIVDSEEELGSPNLAAAVERHREALAADRLVILDGPPHVSGRPTLVFGARGIATITLTTYGPRAPQHSGHYGNYAPNPALGMARILASMKDAEGRVTIPGFYDGVEIDAATRSELERVPDDPEEIDARLGIASPDAVAGSLQEAIQYPSLNVRGLSSGWVGEQVRTIIPATATAEIDVRLVLESDPERLIGLIRGQIESLGYRVLDREPTEEERRSHPLLATFTSEVSYGAFRTPLDSEIGHWLSRALTRLNGEEPIRIRTHGGSVPISPFVKTLGVPAVSVPTVNPDNNQHSPDENLRLGDFERGIATVLAVLSEPLKPD